MIDTVENVALKQWNTNVLQGLSVRLKANGMAPEVDRVLAFFMSRDLTRDDLRKMCIDVVHSSEKAAELHQEQPELSPLVTLDSREDELRKAVALHRERWVTDPTAGADLASSLRDLGAHLHATGHYQGALRVNEQAVDLLRRLTETDPTFTKDVASALSAVGEDLRTAGRNEDALRADEETVDLLRTLVEMDPSVRQDLGRSLRNLALDLHATGHHNDALRANEEAGQLFLELTRTEAISIKELAGLSPLESFAENYAQVERGTEAAGVDTELETRRRTPSEEHAATEPTKERVKEDTNLPLQVYLPPDFQYVDALFPPKALESQPERQLFARTTFMDMADLALRNAENSDEFEIDNVSLKLENPVTRRLGKDMVKHLPNVIDGIAHFMYFLNRQKGSTSQGGIALEMHRLVGHFPGRRPDPTAGNITVDSNEVRFRQEPGAKYGFTIRNNSAIDLLPYLFYFDPDQYTIFCWYKPDNALPPLRSHGVVTIGMGGELAFLFQLPPGVSSSTGFLKLFVSTEHLHLESIVQKISPFDPEFQPRRLKIDQDPFLAAKDWDTLRVTLKITAK
ncbi:hypothetical protein FB451DRAFT_770989 [Mycena latifolia]|nr:hypothetical protein FB451DRAFT_770989 [Mycena latifolia]